MNRTEALKWFRYDRSTGKLYWKAKPNRRIKVGSEAGVLSHGYRQIRLNGQGYKAHRLVWLIETGAFPEHQIDHINGDRSDNRYWNLRDVPQSENCRNMRRPKHNTNGTVGVRLDARVNRFQAYIQIGGVFTHIGMYGTEGEAIAARRQYQLEHGFTARHGA